jgi:hypothetical protein
MNLTEHIACSQGIAKVGPNSDVSNTSLSEASLRAVL